MKRNNDAISCLGMLSNTAVGLEVATAESNNLTLLTKRPSFRSSFLRPLVSCFAAFVEYANQSALKHESKPPLASILDFICIAVAAKKTKTSPLLYFYLFLGHSYFYLFIYILCISDIYNYIYNSNTQNINIYLLYILHLYYIISL